MNMGRLTAWLGGGVFVASLAVCAWWYFVALGRVAQDVGGAQGAGVASGFSPAILFNTLLLTIFALHHSLFAREAIKRRLSMIPAHLIRTVYVWVASLLLLAVIAFWRPIGGSLYAARGPLALALVVVEMIGLWLIARAVQGIDALELAGIRAAARERPPDPLQTGGPYRIVRHPLYLGWMLLLFGVPHMTGDRLLFAAVTSLYLVIAIPLEERSLVQSFGDEYRRYRSRVRWRVIPFVY
jgi:methanethiol S-methyltransferase